MSKRARTAYKKKFTKRKRKFNKKTRKTTFKKRVQRVIDKNLQTKLSVYKVENVFTSIGGTVQLYHNHVTTLDANIIYTSQGLSQPAQPRHIGISFQFALELDVTQIECHFKIFIVKSARGDLPTDNHDSTLFVNVTGNNMMHYVNRKRFTIIKTKSMTLKRTHGLGVVGTIHTFESGAGQVDTVNASTRSGPIMKMSVPGTTFGENGNIIYGPDLTSLSTPHSPSSLNTVIIFLDM